MYLTLREQRSRRKYQRRRGLNLGVLMQSIAYTRVCMHHPLWVSKLEVPLVMIIVQSREKLVQTMTLDGDTSFLLSGVNGRMSRLIRPLGFFIFFQEELQRTVVLTSKENANVNKRRFGGALENHFVKRRRKEEITLEKKYEDATEGYIVAIYFHEQYHSPCCWITLEVSAEFYSALGIETARLVTVKEQIRIRYLRLGWELAHNAWSEGGKNFSSKEL